MCDGLGVMHVDDDVSHLSQNTQLPSNVVSAESAVANCAAPYASLDVSNSDDFFHDIMV